MSDQHIPLTAPNGVKFDNVIQSLLHFVDHYMTDDIERLVMESEHSIKRWERVDELEKSVAEFGSPELIAVYQGDLWMAWMSRFRKFKHQGFVEGLSAAMKKLDGGADVFHEDEQPENPEPDLSDAAVAMHKTTYFHLSDSELFDRLVQTADDEFELNTHRVYQLSYRRGAQAACALHMMLRGEILLS